MLVCFLASAQTVKYPFQDLVKRGDYQEAKTTVEKELKKTPNAPGLNYTLYKLYSTKTYNGYSLERAYECLEKSWNSFKTLKGENLDLANKNGFDEELYKVNMKWVCNEIYETTIATDNSIQSYNYFIETFKLAPDSLMRIAKSERDHLRRMGANEEETMENYCDALKNNPKAAWAKNAKKHLLEAALKGDDLRLMECAVDIYSGEEQEKLFGKMHELWVARNLEFVDSLYKKYDSYRSPTLRMHKERDLRMKAFMDAAEDKNSPKLIEMVAPYNFGVVMLAQYIDSLRTKENYDEAKLLKVADRYKTFYGGNQWYRNFMKTLAAKVDPSVVVNNLGENINTKGSEYAPYISADDQTLYFVGRFRQDNVGGEDIYYSRRDSDGWSSPLMINVLNTANGNEAIQAVSTNGEEMIMFKNGKFYQSKRRGGSWGKPVKMDINISAWQGDAIYSSDGKAILFAARTCLPWELQWSENLYVSVMDSTGKWGKPMELGQTINTPFNERAPFLHPDMKTLYFCSEGHGGQGSYDVWMSKRLRDDSWTEWSEPVNLGREINSASMECWYKISTDGTLAYFSKEMGEKDEDLCSIKLPQGMRPESIAIIRGHLIDKKGKPLEGVIRWEDLETGKQIGSITTNGLDGSYFIVLPLGKNYGYFVDKKGYYPVSSSIDLRGQKNNVTKDQDIVAVSIEEMISENVEVPINNLFFETGKSDLLPESRSELNRVAVILKSLKCSVEISGHTDNKGNPEKNQTLSEDRANAVKKYLINQGCLSGWFTAVGYGQDRPKDTNDTAEGRQHNRRVEIKLKK